MKRITSWIVTAVVLMTAVAFAEPGEDQASQSRIFRSGSSWVEELKGTIPASRMLHVRTSVGSVEVHGENQSAIVYVITKKAGRSSEASARRDFENFRVSAGKRGETAYFDANSGNDFDDFSVTFNISVPHNLEMVKIDTRGGNVVVKNIAGKVSGETLGGNMQMDGLGGSLSALTRGGNIDVGKVGGDVVLRTAGGNVFVQSAGGAIRAETSGGSIGVGYGSKDVKVQTAGGNITVKNCHGALQAATAGGSIDVGDVGAAAAMETAGGTIRLGSANGKVIASSMAGGIRLSRVSQGVQARTAAGPIEVQFLSSHGEFAESSLETMMGDISVRLPEGLRANLRAAINAADGHDIRSEFGEINVNNEAGDFGPRELYAEGSLNGGGPTLRIHTTAGDIRILRAKR